MWRAPCQHCSRQAHGRGRFGNLLRIPGGHRREAELVGLAQELVAREPTLAESGTDYQQVLGNLTQLAPSFSLRGGTLEILRGIIARGLGLR